MTAVTTTTVGPDRTCISLTPETRRKLRDICEATGLHRDAEAIRWAVNWLYETIDVAGSEILGDLSKPVINDTGVEGATPAEVEKAKPPVPDFMLEALPTCPTECCRCGAMLDKFNRQGWHHYKQDLGCVWCCADCWVDPVPPPPKPKLPAKKLGPKPWHNRTTIYLPTETLWKINTLHKAAGLRMRSGEARSEIIRRAVDWAWETVNSVEPDMLAAIADTTSPYSSSPWMADVELATGRASEKYGWGKLLRQVRSSSSQENDQS